MQNDDRKIKFTLRLCTYHCSVDIPMTTATEHDLGESYNYCNLCGPSGVERGLDSIISLDMGANFTTLLGVRVNFFRWLNILQL